MTMRYAHLSPAHLKDAVNKASLLGLANPAKRTVTETVTNEGELVTEKSQISPEETGILEGNSGGAGRVRTAASQFCRLLP